MRQIPASFLLLLGVAAVPAQEKFKAEAKASETVAEVRGAKRPAFLLEGTASFPSGSQFSCYVYSGKVAMGRHLGYQAAEVKDGKYSVTFAVFPKTTLPGKYVFQVIFNPFLQTQEIQEKLGRGYRDYTFSAELTVGTEAEIARARQQTFARLGAEIAELQSITRETSARLADAKKSFDKAAWKKLCEGWHERCHGVTERTHAVPEYQALGIDDISEQTIDDLIQVVERLLVAATSCLESPEKAAEWEKTIQSLMGNFDRIRRPIVQRLGLEKASAKEMAESLGRVRKHVAEGLDLYEWLRTHPKATVDLFHGRLGDHRKKFKELVLAMDEVAPEKYHEGIQRVMEKGLAWLKRLDEAGDAKDDQGEDLRKSLEEFVKEAADLESTFKD